MINFNKDDDIRLRETEKKEVKILVLEEDGKQESQISENLKWVGIRNCITKYTNSSHLLDFLFSEKMRETCNDGYSYLLFIELLEEHNRASLDVIRKIAADERLSKISVIVIADENESPLQMACRNLGCCNFITKPIVYESLLEILRKAGLFFMIVDMPVIKWTADTDTAELETK